MNAEHLYCCHEECVKFCMMHVVNVRPMSWLEEHPEIGLDPNSVPFTHLTPPSSLPLPEPEPLLEEEEEEKKEEEEDLVGLNILSLPNELMLQIFSYLDPQDLDQNVSLVCRRWHDITQHASLRRHLFLSDSDEISTNNARSRITIAKKLVDLRLSGRHDVVPIIRHAADNSRELRRLTIRNIDYLPKKKAFLGAIWALFYSTQLEALCITKCKTRMFSRPFFGRLQPYMENIRKLNFNFTTGLSREHLNMIVDHCPRLEDFRALVWSPSFKNAFVFNDYDINMLTKVSDTLQVLKIDAFFVTDMGMLALRTFGNLRNLYLRNLCRVSDTGLSSLLSFTQLESLRLSSVRCSSRVGWVEIMSNSNWSRLQKLAVIDSPFDNDAARYVAINYGARLRSLNVAACRNLSLNGLRCIMKSCVNLEKVTLCLSQADGCIYWIPSCVPGIKKIVYHSCSFPPDSHVELYAPYIDDERILDDDYFPETDLILEDA